MFAVARPFLQTGAEHTRPCPIDRYTVSPGHADSFSGILRLRYL
jgi:hypothetical protein